MQLEGGLDGFLAIEKHLLMKRGIFDNTIQLPPVTWELDPETRSEVDRLFARMQTVVRNDMRGSLEPAAGCSASWSDGIIG
jgi:4-hydroxy-tetrahydrodipicolinate synthase